MPDETTRSAASTLLPCYCHGDELVAYCPRHTPLPGEEPRNAAIRREPDLTEIRNRDRIGRDWLASQHSFDLPESEWLGIVTDSELVWLCDRANDYEFDVNVPLAELREENERLREALVHFANPQHWAVSRRFVTPEHVWIGTVEKHPSVLAKEGLDRA